MLRPVMKTRRPVRRAASMTCWTRAMREAKVATMTRPSGRRHDLGQRATDDLLGRRVAGDLGVGGVGHEQQDAFVAELGQAREVRDLAHHGRVVELEVAGVYDGAQGRLDGEADGIRDAVSDAEGLDAEDADVDCLAGEDDAHVAVVGEAVLL